MADLITVIASIGAMVVFGMFAVTFGTDSRPNYGDDHARS